MEIGLQTFTVRKEQKRDIESALLPVIKLGIKKFELARLDFNEKNAKTVKALVDKYGLEIVSMQVKPK